MCGRRLSFVPACVALGMAFSVGRHGAAGSGGGASPSTVPALAGPRAAGYSGT